MAGIGSPPRPVARLLANLAGVARTVDRRTALHYAAALVRHGREVVAARNLLPIDAHMRERATTFDVEGTRITLPGRDFSGAREMYCRRVYLSDPRVRLVPGVTVVDLGANTGLFTLLAARRGCRVLAVEAQQGFVAELLERVRSQGCADRVEVECALVGGGVGLFRQPDDVKAASHYRDGQALPVVPVGALLDRHGIGKVGFLKVNVEGAEFAIFEKLEPWMRAVNRIAMEIHGEFGEAAPLREVLKEAGLSSALLSDLMSPIDALNGASGYLFAWRKQAH